MKKLLKRVLIISLAALVFTGCTVLDIDEGFDKLTSSISDGYDEFVRESVIAQPVVVESVSYDRYAYQQLDENTQQVYDQILDCMRNFDEKVSLLTYDTDVLSLAYQAVFADYGDIFWVSGYQYNTYTSGDKIVGMEFAPKYTMTLERKEQYQRLIDDTVSIWLSGISMDASDFDKALYVYEYLVNNVDYVSGSDNNQNIISTFLNKETVCQGYANGAWYMLQELGIKSTIVIGTANGEPHAWNLVYLDGAYYFMDATWGNSKYTDGNNTSKHINYAYMATTSEELSITHILDMPFDIPECLSTADNYYVHNGLYFEGWDSGAVGRVLEESWDTGEEFCTLKFSNSELYASMISYFIDDRHLADFCWGLESVSYIQDENNCIITFQW